MDLCRAGQCSKSMYNLDDGRGTVGKQFGCVVIRSRSGNVKRPSSSCYCVYYGGNNWMEAQAIVLCCKMKYCMRWVRGGPAFARSRVNERAMRNAQPGCQGDLKRMTKQQQRQREKQRKNMTHQDTCLSRCSAVNPGEG